VDWAWLDIGGQDVESGELTTCVGDDTEPLSLSLLVYTHFDDVVSYADSQTIGKGNVKGNL